MKKLFAIIMVIAMLLSLVACGAKEEPNEVKEPEPPAEVPVEEVKEEAAEEPIEAPVEEPVEEAPSFGGANSWQIEEFFSHTKTNVNFTLPESMWVVNAESYTLYVYNVESLDVAHSAAPRIQFETKGTFEEVDSYMKDASELVDLDSRLIGGIEMTGRSYKLWGMLWTEYYGQLPDGLWMTVKISKTSVDAGSEGSDILDSVTFETA